MSIYVSCQMIHIRVVCTLFRDLRSKLTANRLSPGYSNKSLLRKLACRSPFTRHFKCSHQMTECRQGFTETERAFPYCHTKWHPCNLLQMSIHYQAGGCAITGSRVRKTSAWGSTDYADWFRNICEIKERREAGSFSWPSTQSDKTALISKRQDPHLSQRVETGRLRGAS